MSIHTETVGYRHAYTHADVPWQMDTAPDSAVTSTRKSRAAWRLFHYISSGGMRTFGRTVEQDEVTWRQRRFAIGALVFAIAWLILYLI